MNIFEDLRLAYIYYKIIFNVLVKNIKIPLNTMNYISIYTGDNMLSKRWDNKRNVTVLFFVHEMFFRLTMAQVSEAL